MNLNPWERRRRDYWMGLFYRIASQLSQLPQLPQLPQSSNLIALNYRTVLASSQERAFEQAKTKWNELFLEELTPVLVDGELTTQIHLDVRVTEIDGVNGTLGQAGPTAIRGDSKLPATGVMEFDSADLAKLESEGLLESVILHEMGNCLVLVWDIWDLHGIVSVY